MRRLRLPRNASGSMHSRNLVGYALRERATCYSKKEIESVPYARGLVMSRIRYSLKEVPRGGEADGMGRKGLGRERELER